MPVNGDSLILKLAGVFLTLLTWEKGRYSVFYDEIIGRIDSHDNLAYGGALHWRFLPHGPFEAVYFIGLGHETVRTLRAEVSAVGRGFGPEGELARWVVRKRVLALAASAAAAVAGAHCCGPY